MHYRVGWLVERLSTLESIHLLRQGLDVRSLSAERPARKRKGEDDAESAADDAPRAADDEEAPEGVDPALTTADEDAQPVTPTADGG